MPYDFTPFDPSSLGISPGDPSTLGGISSSPANESQLPLPSTPSPANSSPTSEGTAGQEGPVSLVGGLYNYLFPNSEPVPAGMGVREAVAGSGPTPPSGDTRSLVNDLAGAPLPSPIPRSPVGVPPNPPPSTSSPSTVENSAEVTPLFTGGDAGKPLPPSGPPPMMKAQSTVGGQETQTIIPSEYSSQIEEGQRKQIDAAQSVSTVMKSLSSDKPYQAQLTQQIARAAWLDKLTDPNSPEFDKFHKSFADAAGKIDQAQKDLADFQKNVKIDPDRYMNSQPSLSNALNSVAIFFERRANAYGSALGQAPSNMIQGRIDMAVQQDIQRQKEEMQGKQAGMTNDINRYRDNLKMLGDERQAELKTAADSYTMGAMYLNALKDSRIGATLDQAKIDSEVGKLVEKAGLTNADLHKNIVQNSTNDLLMANTPKPLSMEEQSKVDARKFNVGDTVLMARDPESAKNMREVSSAVSDLSAKIETMEALRARAGIPGYTGVGADIARAKALGIEIKMQLKKIYGLGVLSGPDLELLEKVSPNPASFGYNSAIYRAIQNSALSKYSSELKQNTDARFDNKQLFNIISSEAKRTSQDVLKRIDSYDEPTLQNNLKSLEEEDRRTDAALKNRNKP